jgi:hypothetical protein
VLGRLGESAELRQAPDEPRAVHDRCRGESKGLVDKPANAVRLWVANSTTRS